MLARRNPKKYLDMRSSWDIIGGRIEPGTELLENLKREIKEEVGLDFAGRANLRAAQDILKTNGRHVVRLTYVGTIEGKPQLSEEHLEIGWFTPVEINNLNPNLDTYFKELLDNQTIIL